jgi:hypothetical protein
MDYEESLLIIRLLHSNLAARNPCGAIDQEKLEFPVCKTFMKWFA